MATSRTTPLMAAGTSMARVGTRVRSLSKVGMTTLSIEEFRIETIPPHRRELAFAAVRSYQKSPAVDPDCPKADAKANNVLVLFEASR